MIKRTALDGRGCCSGVMWLQIWWMAWWGVATCGVVWCDDWLGRWQVVVWRGDLCFAGPG